MSLAGNDGVLGVSSFLGSDNSPHRAVVVVGGEAFRMKASALRGEFATCVPLQCLLLRYTQALLMQVSQTAVCNRLHVCVDAVVAHQQPATQPLLDDDVLQMTQEFISNML